jgi:hypothetical protein
MDDDLRGPPVPDRARSTRKSTIRLHETKSLEDLCRDVKKRCCTVS